jgi:pimeloyl-ACP methyl ester carboxylesterase
MHTRSRPSLYFTDVGTGQPVLVIPGWTISSAVFDGMAEQFVPHARIIAYDHRGTGRSAPWYGPVSVASLAADAARLLDDRGLPSAHIVGLSLGAAVALELAVRMPARVRTLCLIGGGTGGPGSAHPAAGDAVRAASALAMDTVRHRQVWPAAVLFSDAFRREHPERVEELTRTFTVHRAPAWAVGWQAIAAACFAGRSALASITAPTLVLHGGQDVMSAVENARTIAAAIPHSRLHVWPDAGHAAPLEHPEQATRLMLDWITRHAARIPSPATPREQVIERLTRPLALPAGAAANTLDALRRARRGRPRGRDRVRPR